MDHPHQGFLSHDDNNNQWNFVQGRNFTKTNNTIPLDPSIKPQDLIRQQKLAPGWISTKKMEQKITLGEAQEITARRIQLLHTTNPLSLSDTSLQHAQHNNLILYHGKQPVIQFNKDSLPQNLKDHKSMSINSKHLWDAAYQKEYYGLHETTKTWYYITEKEYRTLKKTVGKALPSMAIATIKRDENGSPTRAKYRLVVLGNLDPNNWSKQDCYAPVLSQLEFRLLAAVSCYLQCKIRIRDFTQAFCQSILPSNERYIIRHQRIVTSRHHKHIWTSSKHSVDLNEVLVTGTRKQNPHYWPWVLCSCQIAHAY